jgi:uncharacterized membrane protein YidH (DUF202 family)
MAIHLPSAPRTPGRSSTTLVADCLNIPVVRLELNELFDPDISTTATKASPMTWWRFCFLIIPAAGAAAVASFIHTEAQWIYPSIVGLGSGYIVYQLADGLRAVRRGRERPPITEAEGEAAYAQLRGIIARLDESKTPSVETASFLLDTEKDSFERTYSGSDNLESKATTLLGIVAGATSAVGVFGLARTGSAIVTTPIILTAFGFVIVSIVALLYMLRAKTFEIPDMAQYLTAATVGEDNRVALAIMVAQRYRQMREQLRREIEAEPNALFIAYASVALAAALVVLNTFTLGSHAAVPLKKASVAANKAASQHRSNRPTPKAVRTGRPGSP